MKSRTPSGKFISPLVRSIAAREGISYSDLDKTTGTGMDGRITKDDILKILESRKETEEAAKAAETVETVKAAKKNEPSVARSSGDEIIPMDRIRKIIAEHMVMSKRTSTHVTSCLLYTSPSPRDRTRSRMPSSA